MIDLGAAWVHDPVGNPLAEALAAAGIGDPERRGVPLADGGLGRRLGRRARGHGGHRCRRGGLGPPEALAALSGSDRFVDGVEWFLADRELDGRAGELARFGLLWVWGAMLFAAPPDRISLAGAAAFAWGTGGNLVPAGGYRALVDRLAAGLDVRLGTAVTAVEHGGAGVVVDSDERDVRGRPSGGDGAPGRAEGRSARLRPSARRRSRSRR